MKDFQGKVAVVTGTANPQGIGFSTARRFAEEGCRVVLADLDGPGAEARAAELRAGGTDAIAVATDISGCLASQGFLDLPITVFHAQRAGGLRIDHRDPFDRMLIAQAQVEDLPIVTNEVVFDGFGIDRIW